MVRIDSSIVANEATHAGIYSHSEARRNYGRRRPDVGRLLEDQKFLQAISALEKSRPENRTLVCGPDGARGNRNSGMPSYSGADGATSSAVGADAAREGSLLAAKLTAIESAATIGALSQPEAAARCTALRAEHERTTRSYVGTDEASLRANVGRLRAALVSAAVDALRDALRRTLDTIRCEPVTNDGSPFLMARFEGGDMPLLDWLAIGDAGQPGLSALVAEDRFDTCLLVLTRRAV